MRGGGEGEGSQRRGELKEFWFKVTVDAAAEYVEIVIRLEFILRIRAESSRAFPPAPPISLLPIPFFGWREKRIQELPSGMRGNETPSLPRHFAVD